MLFAIFIAHEGKFNDTPTSSHSSMLVKDWAKDNMQYTQTNFTLASYFLPLLRRMLKQNLNYQDTNKRAIQLSRN